MKEDINKIDAAALIKAFSGFRSVRRSDLRKYFEQHSQSATDQAFRRFLYQLEKRQVIAPVGSGVYVFPDSLSPKAKQKKQFSPTWSLELAHLNDVFQKAFPYAEYMLWETRLLHEFMLLQPGQNFTVLETEKDVYESAFNFLSQEYPGRVFLAPDRPIMERYVLPQPGSILVFRLVTEAPGRDIKGIPFPRLEKVLVDIFVEDDVFYFLQGEELVHIFENAFSSYWISEKTLFRYARRRKVSQKLRQFILERARVELSLFSENTK